MSEPLKNSYVFEKRINGKVAWKIYGNDIIDLVYRTISIFYNNKNPNEDIYYRVGSMNRFERYIEC
jgi:hypothetical protein